MDAFEDVAQRRPDTDTLLGDTYLELVRFIRDSTAEYRAAIDSNRQESRGNPQPERAPGIETPLPEEEDDGTREIYKAASSFAPRGIERGKRYSLWPGDTLVRAGVVKPIPDAEAAGSPHVGALAAPGIPGYIAGDHASRLREAFKADPARFLQQRSAPFKALREKAYLSEAEERTVKRALGYTKQDGFEGFIEALFKAVGEPVPK